MSKDSLLPIAIVGLSIFAVIITPIIISQLSGKNIKGVEIGAYLTNNTPFPYIRYLF